MDTAWKFRDMTRFREETEQNTGLELITHTNPEGAADKISSFTHGSKVYTNIMKSDALRQALDSMGFDMIFGSARRDEE